MKAIVLLLFFSGLSISTTAQQNVQFLTEEQPYFRIDTFTVDRKGLIISSDKIESVKFFKDSNAVAVYGDEAKYGAVIMKTKPDTRLLRIKDILAAYKVRRADQELRICVNKTIMSTPEQVLIEGSQILGVEITTDRYWVNTEDANTGEKFINIKTKKAFDR